MLREVSSHQRTNTAGIPLHEAPRRVKFIQTDNGMAVVKGCQRRESVRSYCVIGRVSVWKDENGSGGGWIVVMVAQQWDGALHFI